MNNREKSETLLHYETRRKFIIFLNPKNKDDVFYYQNLSHILINILYFGCRYKQETETLIFDIIKKMKNKNLLKLIPIDYKNLSVMELKKILKKKNMSVHGNKNQLIERLKYE